MPYVMDQLAKGITVIMRQMVSLCKKIEGLCVVNEALSNAGGLKDAFTAWGSLTVQEAVDILDGEGY